MNFSRTEIILNSEALAIQTLLKLMLMVSQSPSVLQASGAGHGYFCYSLFEENY